MTTWKPGDIVLDQQTNAVCEFVHYGLRDVPVWNQLAPAGAYGFAGDLKRPVLLARFADGQRLPVLDLETYAEPRCYHLNGATWSGKCIDCGTVCAPNLDDATDHEPVDSLLPYFGGDDDGCETRALNFGRRHLRVVVER